MSASGFVAAALSVSQALASLEGCWSGEGRLTMQAGPDAASAAGLPFGNAPCFVRDGEQLRVYGGASLFNQSTDYDDVWTLRADGWTSEALAGPHNPGGVVIVRSLEGADPERWSLEAEAVATRDKGEAAGVLRLTRDGDRLSLAFDVTLDGYAGPAAWRATADHVKR